MVERDGFELSVPLGLLVGVAGFELTVDFVADQ
jgi:hypothetical protein